MPQTIPIPSVRFGELEPSHIEALGETPALIVDHGVMPRLFERSVARRRHNKVVDWLSQQTGQEAVHEFRSFATTRHGFPMHVDGVVPRYLQVNTSILHQGQGLRWGWGARFTMARYRLSAPLEDLGVEQMTGGSNPFNEATSLGLSDDKGRYGGGVIGLHERHGHRRPELAQRFEGHIPLGGTIIFINGTGVGETDILMHETSTAIRQGSGEIRDSYLFTRQIILSRVPQAPSH